MKGGDANGQNTYKMPIKPDATGGFEYSVPVDGID
jgi:hypothetical protein